jgi:hypothetical protein
LSIGSLSELVWTCSHPPEYFAIVRHLRFVDVE